jgi:hypothetical protein
MRDVLVLLEQLGFDAAPRWCGVDDRGRDVLTFVEGETFSDCRARVWSDAQVAASARLLRRHHDAVTGSILTGGAEVVCHGDFGPWAPTRSRSMPGRCWPARLTTPRLAAGPTAG